MLVKDLSIEDYHADTTAISRSGLMELKKSPFHYWANYLNPDRPKKEQTDAMIFGNAFHTLVLEPSKFDERFVVMPEKLLLKDVGRVAYDAYKAQIEDIENNCAGMDIITKDKFNILNSMLDSLKSERHKDSYELILGAEYEQSLFWKDPHSGMDCKVRPDIWHENIISDLKTIDSADERSFQSSMMKYGYHIQGAMIREGIRETFGKDIQSIVFITCEKSYPFCCVPYIMDELTLECGLVEFKNLLLKLKECRNTNTWPSYEAKIISLPTWAIK